MSAGRLRTQARRFRRESFETGDSPGGLKKHEMGNRPRGGCTTEGTILEVGVRWGMLMMRVMIRRGGIGAGA